jgi:hypothetical protein
MRRTLNGGNLAAHCCAYRKSNPAVLMMQSTQDRQTENAPSRLDVQTERENLVGDRFRGFLLRHRTIALFNRAKCRIPIVRRFDTWRWRYVAGK